MVMDDSDGQGASYEEVGRLFVFETFPSKKPVRIRTVSHCLLKLGASIESFSFSHEKHDLSRRCRPFNPSCCFVGQ